MYYPLSQITPNLYANEGELVTKKNLKPYSGPYYLVSNGKKFAGATPSNISIELIPDPDLEVDDEKSRYFTISGNLQSGDPDPTTLADAVDVTIPNISNGAIFKEENSRVYEDLSINSKLRTREVPSRYNSKPTLQDSRLGYYSRYFAKKANESIFIEINFETYKKFTSQDPKTAFDLYQVLSLNWMLKSRIKNIIELNKETVKQIEIKNRWVGFYNWFNNAFGKTAIPTQYLYTYGNELLLPNRTNYIGYYHVMENIGFMTGKYHGDGPENTLIPLRENITPTYKSDDGSSQENTSFSSTSSPSTETSSPSSGGGGGY